MKTFLQICGTAIIVLTAVITVKQYRPEIALVISAIGCVLIGIGVINIISPEIDYINELLNGFTGGKAVLQALGIGFITQSAADICRDSGESSLAAKLELCGKAQILIIAIPMLKSLLSSVSGMIPI